MSTKKLRELAEIVDLIGHRDIQGVYAVLWIVPASIDACNLAAPHIAGQRVADQQRLCFVHNASFAKHMFKIGRVGLFISHILRDEHRKIWSSPDRLSFFACAALVPLVTAISV